MLDNPTGRMTSASPAIQQIPIRTPEGKAIKSALEDHVTRAIENIDYGHIELRLREYP